MWRNLVVTLQRTHLSDQLKTFVLDETAWSCANAVPGSGRLVRAAPARPSDGTEALELEPRDLADSEWGTAAFRDVTTRKLELLVAELGDGLRVLYLDVDVAVWRDPLPGLLALPARDAWLQSDERSFQASAVHNFCTGVVFLSPTEGAHRLLRCALDRVSRHGQALGRGRAVPGITVPNDQDALNHCVARGRGKWSVGVLDPAKYPNGFRYFKRRELCASRPVLLHNNYALGQARKVRRFQKLGLWFGGDSAVDGNASLGSDSAPSARDLRVRLKYPSRAAQARAR